MSKKENNKGSGFTLRNYLIAVFIIAGTGFCSAQIAESPAADGESSPQPRVTGLKNISIHVLKLEKTLKLYREILGFKLADAEVYHGPGLEGMLVMKMRANDLEVGLSITAPEFLHTIGPVGNTNHNHIMLKVNDIGPIGDKLKEEGYELENEHYVRDKYTFFTGPNGEIIGLSSW